MDSSPGGKTIEELVGNGPAISQRGHTIEKLGIQMIDSATTLQSIADGTSGQKGLAVDKLKDVVGDCYKELKLAGERYKPNGKPLYNYGEAVSELQPKIKSIVADCEDDWAIYVQKSGSIPSAIPSGAEPSDPSAAKAAQDKADQEHDEAQSAAHTAHQNWKADAQIFDGYYDSWEAAFDDAVSGIKDATNGDIEDSWKDNLDGFVKQALTVLKWVGLALAVLALVIGGPIIGALAAIAAVLTLALTIYSFARGNSSGGDLAWAIVGIVPFGSAGKLFQSGKRLSFLDDVAGGLGSRGGRAAIKANFGDYKNAAHGLVTGFNRAGGGLAGVKRGFMGGYHAAAGPNGAGYANTVSRIFTGQNMADSVAEGRHPVSILLGTGASIRGNLFGIPDAIFNFSGKRADANFQTEVNAASYR